MKKNSQRAVLMVVGMFLIQFFVFTMAANLVPVLQPDITAHYNIQQGFVLIYTIGIIVPAFAAPIIPTIYNKIGYKMGILLGVVLSAGGFMSLGLIPAGLPTQAMLAWCYVAAAIFNVGNSLISAMGIPSLLSQWFTEEEKGKYMGFAFMGASAGNVFITMALKSFMEPSPDNINKIITFLGCIGLVIGIAICLFIIRKPTEEEYKEIHASSTTTSENGVTIQSGYTMDEAMKTPIFKFFVIGLIFLGFYVSALSTQYATIVNELNGGLGSSIRLQVASLFSLCSIGGNLIGGILFDKIKQIPTILVGGVLALGAALSLLLANAIEMHIAFGFSVFYGLSVFTYMLLPGYMTGYLFGQKEYSKILGINQMIFALGFAVGALIFTQVRSAIGTIASLIVIMAFIGISYFSFLTATTIRNKQPKKEA